MNIKFIVKVIEQLHLNRDISLTILQISKKSGLSYNATNRTVHFLNKEGIIDIVKIGSSSVIKLNNTEKSQGFISLAEAYLHEKKR